MEAAFRLNPDHPTSLLYEKTNDGGYKLIGVMYTAPARVNADELDTRVPLSIARWHEHVNFCGAPRGRESEYFGPKAKFGLLGSISTEPECAAAGLAPDHDRWISSHRSFFLPVKVLSRVFRGKFVAALKTAFRETRLEFHGQLAPLAEPRTFASWLRLLFRQDWVVYSKPPFGGPEHVLRYLGAYTHRVAISNHRLLALADGNVSFQWRDSAHGNQKRMMSLPVDEFLRRFLLHLLPRGFMRIRNFGFLANRRRAELLPLCFRLLRPDQASTSTAPSATVSTHSRWNCPLCGGTMQLVERLSAAQLLLRSPPHSGRCAA